MIDREVLLELLQRHADDLLTREESASLQEMLRNDVEARRLFRSYLELDAALTRIGESVLDREVLPGRAAENVLAPAGECVGDDERHAVPQSESGQTIRICRREVIAWLTAAACLMVAVLSWNFRPQEGSRQSAVDGAASIAERNPATAVQTIPATGPSVELPTSAEQREHLLSSVSDVLQIKLIGGDGEDGAQASGDIVWSTERQTGFVRLKRLVKGDSTQTQYQIWIIDTEALGDEFINGGVVIVNRSNGEVILPIQANHFVQQPRMFVISLEPPGGGQELAPPLLAKVGGLEL
jgi:hypothetical protein